MSRLPQTSGAPQNSAIKLAQIANHTIMNLMRYPVLGELAAEVTAAKAVQIG